MKKHGICENHVREMAKSCEINALGFKETSDLLPNDFFKVLYTGLL